MGGWLQKASDKTRSNIGKVSASSLPALRNWDRLVKTFEGEGKSGELPNASLVYGVGSAILIAVAAFFIIGGSYASGLLVLIPAAGLLGFALYFLKYR